MLIIRTEITEDYHQIGKVHDLAFDRRNESKLIESLRKSEDYKKELSIVAELDGYIIGHMLFFPVCIRNLDKESPTLSLGPMAVLPKYQNQGIGTGMILKGLLSASSKGFDSVVVIGHPLYYPKFGFSPASNWGIHPPYLVPDESFMALELKGKSLKNSQGTVEYPSSYSEVETIKKAN